MKMKAWKAVSMSCLSLVVAVAAGCSSNGNKPQDEVGQEANSTTKPEAKKEISVSIYDRGRIAPEEGTYEKNRWTDWINANGPANVNYVAVPRTEAITKFNTLFASGSAPDIIFEFDTAFLSQLYYQKQLMPLDDLIQKYSVDYKKRLEEFPELNKIGVKEDGKHYEFARLVKPSPGSALVIRGDWLKKLNLQVPKTTEELYQVAKAFTERDPDGNGKKDTFGIAMSNWSGVILDHMFGNAVTSVANERIAMVVQNGQLVHDWERIKTATEFKKRLFDDGLVDKDFLTDKDGAKAKQDWLSGKLGIYGYTSPSDTKMFETLLKNNPNAEIIPIELPKSPFGQFSPLMYNPLQSVGSLNAKTKNPEAAIKYIDFMIKQSTVATLTKGLEGVHWKKAANGCDEIIENDQIKNQKGYTGDYLMMANAGFNDPDPKCLKPVFPDVALQEKYDAFKDSYLKAYMSPDRPIPIFVAHPSHMPVLPKEFLSVEKTALEKTYDLVVKAVVSGTSYTVDQAIQDAKLNWEKSNGKQIDDWYKEWYQKDRSKSFLREDLYEFIEKQDRLK